MRIPKLAVAVCLAAAILAVGVGPVASSARVHGATDHRGTHPPKRHGLQGFQPTSMSFVDGETGYLLGYAATSGYKNQWFGPHGMLARTTDGGVTWHRVAAPKVTAVGNDGDAVTTFVSPDVGFIYGRRNFVTTDGAMHWRQADRRRQILDLEYAAGRIWALAHPCRSCHRERLYSATLTHPHLALVRGNVPRFRKGGARFIHGSGDELYVVKATKAKRGRVFRSYHGGSWTKQREPCKTFGAFAAWSEAGLAAVCNTILFGVGNETKRAYVSFDGAHTWTRRGEPGESGYIAYLAAGSSSDWVLSQERTVFSVTADEGATWTYTYPKVGLADGVGQTQFISASHVVSIPIYEPDGVFMSSRDAGQHWTFTRFPKWPRHR